MDCLVKRRSAKDKINQKLTWATFILFWVIITCNAKGPHLSPHFPARYAWELRGTNNGKVIQKLELLRAVRPTFNLDLCDIISLMLTDRCGDANYNRQLKSFQFYLCPASNGPRCGEASQFHCAAWGCESIAPWKTDQDEYIQVKRGPDPGGNCLPRNCNPLTIKIVSDASDETWEAGKTWGLRLYTTGYDPGAEITIQRYSLKSTIKNSIGPNPLNCSLCSKLC